MSSKNKCVEADMILFISLATQRDVHR